MPIPALMTTPYANAKPAARATRQPAPDQTQTALQIMRGLQASDARPSPTIASGMQDVFNDLRGPQKDFGPGMMTPSAGTFEEQNARANVGIYEPGSLGDQNARANGTGFDPVQWMMHAGMAETATVGGSATDAAALNNGLDSWARGGAPAAKSGKSGNAVDMMHGNVPAGPAAALKVSDMRMSLAAARTQQREIDPVLTMLTPGLNPAQRNAKLSADADNQRLTGVPPEMAADRLGYLDKLAVRASGIPEAVTSGREVYKSTRMVAPPIGPDDSYRDPVMRTMLSERQTSEPGGRNVVDMDPLAPSAYDQNRGRTEDLATNAREMMARAGEAGLVDLGKDANGRPIQGLRQPNGKVTPLHSSEGFPRAIDAGGRKLIEVSAGKFTDEKGTPIEWRDDNKPLSVNEFLMSPALSDKFGGDYSKYRDAHSAATKTGEKPAATAAPAPAVIYNHTDVQAELERRGLTKKAAK